MKKLIACIAVVSMLSACHKNSKPACNNTISVDDNGNTYTQCAYEPPPGKRAFTGTGQVIPFPSVYVSLDKMAGPVYSITIVAGNSPFVLSLQNCMSDSGITGTYTVLARDSSTNTYQEQFSGGQSYKCSGGTITVTHADTTNVSGTFALNVFNAGSSKTITGSFNANQPYHTFW